MRITKDDQTEIVVRTALWIAMLAYLMLLLGLWVLGIVLAGRGGESVPALVGVGSILVFLGVWLAGMTTRIRFNQLPGHITVTRGYIPLFFWFLRKKVISQQEARTVRVVVRTIEGGLGAGSRTKYEVKVRTRVGKSVTLFSHSQMEKGGGLAEVARHLEQRILEFGRQ